MRNSFTCQLKACSYSSKTLLQQPQERHLLRSQVYMVGMGLKYVAPSCKSFYCWFQFHLLIFFRYLPEVYFKTSQTSKIELFQK